MANKMGGSGRVVYRKRRSGGRGWRRGAAARRGSDSDGTSDEEYVVDKEEEDGSSYDSYSSDASREETLGAESTSCTEGEEDEEEEYDVSDDEELEAAAGGRPGKGLANSRRKPRAGPPRQRKSAAPALVEEMETARRRKPRARPRRRSRVLATEEEEECQDEDDEDFAPDDSEEGLKRSSVRKTGGRKVGPVKRQRRRTRPRNPKEKAKKKRAPVKKRKRRIAPRSEDDDFVVSDAELAVATNGRNRKTSRGRSGTAKRRRMAPSSDDDDFVVKDRVLAECAERNKRRRRKKKKGISKGMMRRLRVLRSDTSDSSLSNFDYKISEEELRDLQVEGSICLREPILPSPAATGQEKGKGKEIDDLGKQICGICLSEEQKGTIRGVLDCCVHYFCFACIMEWSKVESRCPLCKQRFKTISQLARSGAVLNLRATVKRIPKRDQVYQPSEEEMINYLDPYADVVCMECQRGGNDHLMLLCDLCDSPAHTYCVGLGRVVPEGNWYCDGCRSMNPGSSNSVQEYVVDHVTKDNDLLEDTRGEIDPEIVRNRMPVEISGQLPSLQSPRQSLSRLAQGDSSGSRASLGDHVTSLPASGLAASTVSGRRSIHQHIRVMLSNNTMRSIPEGVATNVAMQPSSVESDVCNSGVEQPVETLHTQKESVVNRRNERSSRPILAPRSNMHQRTTHIGATSLSIVEGSKARVQAMVKNHLKCWTRDKPLERRGFKDIARRATHTILAACRLPHRGAMLSLPVQSPPSCVHRADGELAVLVKDCCSPCFTSFVKSVVRRLLDWKLPPHGSVRDDTRASIGFF